MSLHRVVVTTSWDDGDRADLKLADLLHSRGVTGTLYVPIQPYLGRPALTRNELRSLSDAGFEIGAHGVDHEHMPSLSRERTLSVVRECKNRLESTVGQSVRMFCYPGGHFTPTTVRCLADTGYHGARTTRMLATRSSFDRFEMPTTIQAYPHRGFTYLKNTVKAKRPARLYNYALGGRNSWVDLGKRIFDRVLREGGVWHLYGHSWEVEDNGLWDGLTELIQYVSNHKGVLYLTNGDALAMLQPGIDAIRERMQSRENTPSTQQVPTAGR
jgi:peptidoglycan/xylan/chitin deacetylase (PgdA/CDA1 family)